MEVFYLSHFSDFLFFYYNCFCEIKKSISTSGKLIAWRKQQQQNKVHIIYCQYLSHLNRLCSWISVVKVLGYPVQSQADRRAKNGCWGKLCPVSAIWLHPVDLTLRDRGKLFSATLYCAYYSINVLKCHLTVTLWIDRDIINSMQLVSPLCT